MISSKHILFLISFAFFFLFAQSQYVETERDDTIRLYAKTPFNTTIARTALASGTGMIKGVAFIKVGKDGKRSFLGNKLYADSVTVVLFPVTPYLLEYLDMKKKENPKKLKFAYINPEAWRYHLEAVTNSVGEFTFPGIKPGKYYLEAILPWKQSDAYHKSSSLHYDCIYIDPDHYTSQAYAVYHDDKLTKFIEMQKEGEVLEIKLK